MNPWLATLLGFVLGGWTGAAIMAMLAAGSRDDDAHGRG